MTRIGFILMIVLLAACSEVERTLPEKGQLEITNSLEIVQITNSVELNLIINALQLVHWQPDIEPQWARDSDLELRLFTAQDKNMPEVMENYEIWMENDDSITLMSVDKTEGYGRLDSKKGQQLVQLLREEIPALQPVYAMHGKIDNREGFDQFLMKVQRKQPATVRMIHYTVEGDPIYTRVDTYGKTFTVEVDNHQDRFGEQTLKSYTCENLTSLLIGERMHYQLEQCDGGVSVVPIIDFPFDAENQQFTTNDLPELKLVIGQHEIPLQKGTFAWTVPTSNPSETSTIQADHASPNQMLHIESAIMVEKSAQISIQFSVEPTSVEYRIWNQQQMIGTYPTFESIQEEGPFILEVTAYWGDNYATYVAALQFQ